MAERGGVGGRNNQWWIMTIHRKSGCRARARTARYHHQPVFLFLGFFFLWLVFDDPRAAISYHAPTLARAAMAFRWLSITWAAFVYKSVINPVELYAYKCSIPPHLHMTQHHLPHARICYETWQLFLGFFFRFLFGSVPCCCLYSEGCLNDEGPSRPYRKGLNLYISLFLL